MSVIKVDIVVKFFELNGKIYVIIVVFFSDSVFYF